ncbi:hypothetical protein [Lacinutrix sp. Hel_I_90]|uniref:hypothetical protein n=1 Tax=Lacinutrix sp. Hel_I_90 TaxID=1249999 RepID=UPI0005C98F9B|nr:hypothetical protein [Lacinutrix sp. Hel_I_90]
MSTQNNNIGDKPLRVRRGRVDSVDLFEVKEHELEILENGDTNSIYLNFAIFLLSSAVSCVLAISTANFVSELIQYCFLFVTIIGFIGGLFLLILWWRGRKSIKKIVSIIKNRIPPEFIEQEQASNIPENTTVQEDISPK